jgi:5S rRNA maturation endonuclease (ribonuclease M5)
MLPKVEVKNDIITGKIPKFEKYLNLSSAPHDWVSGLIARVDKSGDTPTGINLYARTKWVSHLQMMKKAPRTIKVIVVVDADDKEQDIKIKNLMSVQKIKFIGKMVIKREKCKTPNVSASGKSIRLANGHHTAEVIKSLTAEQIHPKTLNKVVHVHIVSTSDDHAGSIAGLTAYLNIRNICFEVVTQQVKYPEGWITTKKHNPKIKMEHNGYTTDINPQNDTLWMFKTGYDNYMVSEKGPTKVTLKKQAMKQAKESMRQRFMKWIRKIVQKIKAWFTKDKPKDEKPKSGLAWTPILAQAVNTANGAILGYSIKTSVNASKDIDEANKLLSNMATNKMMAKVGPSGDKTPLLIKTSRAYNAYMAAMTNFNVVDATVHSNNIAAKENRSTRLRMAYLSLAVTCIYLIVVKSYLLIAALFAITLIVTVVPGLKPELVTILAMLASSTTVLGLVKSTVIAVVELVIKPPTSTSGFRVALYACISVLQLL